MRSALLLLASLLCVAAGEATAPATPVPPLSIAVMPCEMGEAGLIELAQALPELVATTLGRDPAFQLVERARLDKVLQEQALGASGLADPAQAARIGHLLGARAMIMLRTYRVGRQVFATARAVEVESGKLIPVTKADTGRDPSPTVLASMLCEDLVPRLKREYAAAPVADDDSETAQLIATLRKAIGEGPLPRVTVVVPEEHVRRPIPDPAVRTELSYLLRRLGFRVIENDSPLLDAWVRDQFAGKAAAFPADIGAIDVVIYGGAFAETIGNTANLVSARARLELSAIATGNGEMLTVIARTASAADLSEAVAAKSALQKSGREAAREFIPELAKAWRLAAKAGDQAKPVQPAKPREPAKVSETPAKP
jgi:hypothetical protein